MLPRLSFFRTRALLLVSGALLSAALVPVALASIERLTLRQMVHKTDGAVYGEIVDRIVTAVTVFDGAEELYFTTLHVEGRSLFNGKKSKVAVSFPGGFLDGERGVYNSEAPSADDQALGNRVIVFYKWSDNMGGGFASNALYASHGGLFRTFVTRKGDVVVQGRGVGYAVPANRTLGHLETEVLEHRETRDK